MSTPATPESPETPTTVRHALHRPARVHAGSLPAVVLSGVLVVAATGAAAAAGSLLPAPTAQERDAGTPVVTLDPVEVRAACAGPAEALMGPGAVVDPAAPPEDSAARSVRVAGTLPSGGVGAAPATLDGTELPRVGPLTLGGGDVTGPGVLVAQPRDGHTALPVGSTLTLARGGDLRGLSAVPCLPASGEAWLVGGSTEVGSSTALHLSNLGETPARVDVQALGSLGELAAPALEGITLAPGATTSVPLEGALAPDPAPALRVRAGGGAVAAWGQTLALDGVVPAGVSGLSPVAEPATSLLVPGLRGEGTLRVVNPAGSPVRVTIAGVEENGERRELGEVEVPARSSVETPVAEGPEVIALSAEGPVTAGVELRSVGSPSLLDPDTPPVDTAWAPAVEARTTGAWALPGADTRARLVMASASERAGTVTFTLYRGAAAHPSTTEVALAPGGTSAVDLPADTRAVDVQGDVPVAASVVLGAEGTDGSFVEVLPATPDPHAEQSLRVDVR